MKTAHIPTRTPVRRQVGLTLIETLIALSIFALVVGGAIALFGGASSSQATTQMTSDLSAVRAATKSLYFGQGTYGTAALTEVLINGKKIPTTMFISGATAPHTVNHPFNGTVVVTGATSKFTVVTTNIPTDVCIGLATMQGWESVKVGTTTLLAPVTPVGASTSCAGAPTQDITFTGS
jgi:type II secretory pathway pseudopilin PulG